MERSQIRLSIFWVALVLLLGLAGLLAEFWTLLIIGIFALVPAVVFSLVRLIRAVPPRKLLSRNVWIILVLVFLAAALFLSSGVWFLRLRAPARLDCDRYTLRLAFDPSHNTFTGVQEIHVSGELSSPYDTADAVSAGEIVQWSESNATMRALARSDLIGWTIKDIQITQPPQMEEDNEHPLARTAIKATLKSDQLEISTVRKGWFRYATEIRMPRIVRTLGDENDSKIEIVLAAPRYTFLSHNLNGSFSETVLENNEIGQSLTASKVNDPHNVIRLNYASSFFQHPFTNKIINFSFLDVLFYLASLIFGIIGYLVGVVLDVFKDSSLKPNATALLRRIGLIKKAA